MKSTENFPKLFEHARIGSVKLKNRLVMLPMGTAYASQHGEVTQKTIDYFVERAKGGVGLITLGNVSPYLPNIVNQLVLDSDWVLMGHYELAEKLHAHGAKVCVQINHAGRQKSYNTLLPGEEVVSSSPLASERLGSKFPIPRALEKDEIRWWTEKYATAAMRAKKVGYDMVEVHGGHGYLINQFISPFMNKRTDEYGGTLKNRMRFPLEIIKAVRDAVGPDYPIGFRISADEYVTGGVTIEESTVIVGMLEAAGVDYISVTAGIYESSDKMMCTMRVAEGWRKPLWTAIHKAVKIPVIAGGSLRHPDRCEHILEEDEADFIGLARPLFGDPEWPIKAREGRIEDIRFCISCNECAHESTRRRSGERHCTINAATGREKEFAEIIPAGVPKKVMVVGAGPAGMEAARIAALRGHQVTLYEKEKILGGQLNLASRPQSKRRILWLRDYLENQLKKLGVNIILETYVTPELVRAIMPDALILAAGAEPIRLDIPGTDANFVLNCWDLLQDKINPRKEKIAVVGGGMIGVEVAEYLLELDNQITIIEQLPFLAEGMEPNHKKQLLDLFDKKGVSILTSRRAVEIKNKQLALLNIATGVNETIAVDRIVVAVGTKPSNALLDEFENIIDDLYVVGDCNKVGFIMEAIYEGSLIGHRL
ncbi:MAG: FAD-dependent oxidoreductase [Syntrophaceae bacterium]|nr:FAD-dependent oxidoreductase [Syntrophaceae bacterium]